MTSPPRTRDENVDVYLKIWAQVETAQRRVADVLELGKHADVLNAVAPSFFNLVQSLMIGDAVLALCRVMDPAEYKRKERLSVRLLNRTTRGGPSLKDVEKAMKPLRDLRNNWIGHSDLESALSGNGSTIVMGELKAAIDLLQKWLKEFGTIAEFPTSDPVDQGTWLSAPSLTAALRDASAVHAAYVLLLEEARKHGVRAEKVDLQLTTNRAMWESPAFSELEWLRIRQRVFEVGIRRTTNELDWNSPYVVILAQAGSPNHDLTRNYTDRRIAARVRSEADSLLRELQFRAGIQVVGLGTDVS